MSAANNTQLCEERGAEGYLSILSVHLSKYSKGHLKGLGMSACRHSLTSLLLSLTDFSSRFL